MSLRGWRVRFIFNDPALYGLEVTCDEGLFTGFKFEILYQKLGPHLGVYYASVTIPEQYRQINLGAAALTLPTFKIWIYTNGDFKVSVGWPLGGQFYWYSGKHLHWRLCVLLRKAEEC